MGNPLYDILMGQRQPQVPAGFQSMNPMQRTSAIMQAMRDPAGFVKSVFPDIPDNISGDPNRILQYLQQSRGLTNEQIQQAANSIPRF